MATWPATLPAASVDGHAATATIAASRPDFAAGWTSPNRLATNLPQRVSASWLLTGEQMRDLTRFAHDHAGEWAVMPLRLPQEGAASTSIKARFTGGLSASVVATYWRLSAELEIAA